MNTKITMIFLTLGITFSVFCQSVGINETGAEPNSSAILDVESTSKGFLPPRMTTSERNSISNPANGLMIFNTTTGTMNYFSGGWHEVTGILIGFISNLDCINATHTGPLVGGVTANGVSSTVSYTGGNGGVHNGNIALSTGVTGLTATLAADHFANGNGTLLYTITGTPSGSGTASFLLNIGGQTCTLTRTVEEFVCGSNTITFTYNGTTVTYGTVLSANNRCWLDRNLGATHVATSSTDAAAYGDLFQWGRLDDGHQVRTSPTTTIPSNSDIPGHGNFIIPQNSPWDWRSPQNNNLWQGENGINNPCPDGYRLPTQAEWNTERLSWNNNNAAGAYASPLKLPLAGRRDSGSVIEEGSSGGYWSSTANVPYSLYLYFESGIAYVGDITRAWGLCVRCLKD